MASLSFSRISHNKFPETLTRVLWHGGVQVGILILIIIFFYSIAIAIFSSVSLFDACFTGTSKIIETVFRITIL